MFPRCANCRCTGRAAMSTEPGNDRLITVHAPFIAKCNFSLSYVRVRSIHNVRTIIAEIVLVCFFGGRKRNVVGKFVKMFETVVDIVACPVQRRFAHRYRGKFQKLFNDRGEILSNLGYSSFPRSQQQCRNRVN